MYGTGRRRIRRHHLFSTPAGWASIEGIVSKRLSAPYRSGPSKDWIKVKNPDSPAMIRAREAEW
jgi:ATP-dependent DNA ligase